MKNTTKPIKLTAKELKTKEARTDLLKYYIKKNTKLLIVIKSVSKSGMSRRMKVLVNNYNITYLVADLCNLSVNDNGLLITGCGMDMAFWLANHITFCLYGKNKPAWLTGNGGNCLDWATA